MTCGYEGSHFGARYPDAVCIDGYLWDLDSCEEPGGALSNGGDVPCPCCNTREYIDGGDSAPTGNAHQRRIQRRALIRKVRGWAVVPFATHEGRAS